MSITILVGDVDEYLCHLAREIDTSARLLTYENSNLISPGVYYTSLGDFPSYRSFVDVLDLADHIIYCPPKKWSDQDRKGTSMMQTWTKRVLWYFKDKKLVEDAAAFDQFDCSQILRLVDYRKTEKNQLWIVGGSDSHGDGVRSAERYGEIMANLLGLSVSFLTETNSSLEWAADQILRSDIRSGDIIIWGLVPPSRFPFYINDGVKHISHSTFLMQSKIIKHVDINHLDNANTLLYKSITNIEKVINICDKLGIVLVLAGLASPAEYTMYFINNKNYIDLSSRFGLNPEDKFLDLGVDGCHPGPKMHRWYADQLLAKLTKMQDSN